MKKIIFFVLTICMVGLWADGTHPIGLGSESNPYLIQSLDNLLWISTTDTCWSSIFLQIADIDAAQTQSWNNGEGFSPIGLNMNNAFSGNYNGNGFKIENLYINRPSTFDPVSLFGHVTGAELQRISIVNANITGQFNVGGIVGYAYLSSIVKNCYSTGSVSGSSEIGGIVGYQWDNVEIRKCYSTASISASQSGAAGIVGMSFTSNVYDCFWNTETSGITSTNGFGTGITTAQMQSVSTFTSLSTAGLTDPWDFSGNPNDDVSNEDYWMISSTINNGFPILNQPGSDSVFADFSVNNRIALIGQTLNFSSTVSSNATDLTWDFDNDNIVDSSDENPQWNYNNTGIYTVKLVASDGNTIDSVTKTNYIAVVQQNPENTTIQDQAGVPITFEMFSGNADSLLTYSWTVNSQTAGDSTAVLTHTFINDGIYNIECSVYLDSESESFSWQADIAMTNNISNFAQLLTRLNNVYPNPFNPETNIDFSIKSTGNVTLEVYNLKGQRVKTLIDNSVEAGEHSVIWHGDTDSGKSAATGVYFIKLRTNEYQKTKKVMMIK